jgi:hypothetical protein
MYISIPEVHAVLRCGPVNEPKVQKCVRLFGPAVDLHLFFEKKIEKKIV